MSENDPFKYVSNKITPSNAKKFKYFDELIHSGEKHIVLDSDIALKGAEEFFYLKGIRLDVDDLVIDGAGHVIDAKNKSLVFYISGNNITVKNLVIKGGFFRELGGAVYNVGESNTFENCLFKENRTTYSGYGGAAICNRSDLSIIGCTFLYNHASRKGGAVYNDGVLTVEDSTFRYNNVYDGSGGAIYNKKELLIFNSIFIGNSADNKKGKCDAGAIFSSGDLKIFDSKFKDNYANSYGGAIVAGGDFNIERSVLMNNSSEFGGAIYNSNNLRMADCNISDNSSDYGGAVYGSGIITIEDSTLCNNRVEEDGGAISSNGDINLAGCLLSGNSAGGCGGAISHSWKKDLKIDDSKFLENKSKHGSAIFSESCNVIITNSFLSNNTATDNGIIVNGNNLKIFNCEFNDNYSENSVICDIEDDNLSHDLYLQIYDTIFKENTSKNIIGSFQEKSNCEIFGGKFTDNNVDFAICSGGKQFSLDKTLFENENKAIFNKSNDLSLKHIKIKGESASILNEGHIYIHQSKGDGLEDKIEGCGTYDVIPDAEWNQFDFEYLDNLIHDGETSEIHLENDISLEVYEKEYYEGGIELGIDDVIIDGRGHTIDANGKSCIFVITGRNITLKNIRFINGKTFNDQFNNLNDYGGALRVLLNAEVSIENCKFENNLCLLNGGAIFNLGDLSITDSIFSDNSCKGQGGAIYSKGNLNIDGSSFFKNSAHIGGVIYNQGELCISECEISKNSCEKEGIIYSPNNIIISSSIIHNNSCSSGGIIKNEKNSTVKHSTFIGNESSLGTLNCYNGVLNVSKSIFRFNTSDISAAAINNNGGEMTVEECLFEQNVSNRSAGAVGNYPRETSQIVKSKFKSNTANYEYSDAAGAIANVGNLNIIECEFIGNTTKRNGGAISHSAWDKSHCDLKITDSKFIKNRSAIHGGAIFVQEKSFLHLEGGKFEENAAELGGGAIYDDGGIVFAFGAIFLRNSTELLKAISEKKALEISDVVYSGGAVYLKEGEFHAYSCTFNENTSNKSAGAIENNFGYLEIEYSDFNENVSRKQGGAVVVRGKSSIGNSNFVENVSKYGGAVSVEYGDFKIMKSNFFRNTALEIGGAIVACRPFAVKDSKFAFNVSRLREFEGGGAIYANDDLTVENSEFSKNHSDSVGGAIYVGIRGTLDISSSTFEDNEPDDIHNQKPQN